MLPGKTLISAPRLQRRVRELARAIQSHYAGRPLTILGLMNGSLFFLADLLRELPEETRFECRAVSSYEGRRSRGRLQGLQGDFGFVRGRQILIVDDILDSGLTLHSVAEKIRRAGARDIKICVLLSKKGARKKPVQADWAGFEIANAFVVGYGLDWNGKYRNLPMVRVLP